MIKSFKNTLPLCGLGAFLLAANPVSADSNKELLDVLLLNGVISQAQHEQLVKGMKKEVVAETKSNNADEVKISTEGGHLKFKSGDGDFKFQVGGRVMADAAWYSDDNTELGDGTELRRARLFVKGQLWKDWNFKMQYDFAGGGVIKDAYVRYTGLKHYLGMPLDITAGHFKQPFSLEELTSSRFITFMERALPNAAFVPSRNLGLALNSHGKLAQGSWTGAAGVFGKGADDANDGSDESYGYSGRFTVAPLATKTSLFHLGGNVAYRKLKGHDTKVRSRPESHIADHRLVSATIKDADDVLKYGGELAAMWGPFSVQGEYMKADYSSNSGPDADFDGWYGYVSWFVTGESRTYKSKAGIFDRVTPRSIVGKGGYGAVELAGRYSQLNLNDGPYQGGREKNYTIGVNWYATPSIRLMANYVFVDSKKAGVEDDPQVLQIRAQVDF